MAAPLVDQRFLVLHDVDLDDADVPGGNGEDYFTTNGTYRARHALVYLYENTIPNPTYVGSAYTDDQGLVTFENLDKARHYKLRLFGNHDYNNSGRDLLVLKSPGIMASALSPAFYPNSTVFTVNTLNLSFDAAVPGNEWINAAAIASWMIRRRPGAFPTAAQNGAVYTIIMDDPSNCPTPFNDASAVYCPEDVAVYLDPNDTVSRLFARKFVIAHEFAHELQNWALVPDPTEDPTDWMYDSDYGAAGDSDCLTGDGGTSHGFVTKEYQMAAIVEGMAHYVAAVAFNQTQEADCRFNPGYSVDWLNGAGPQAVEFSCEGYDPTDLVNNLDDGGVESQPGYDIPAGDYCHFAHDTWPHDGCCNEGAEDNRGVELDWLRFFWDLDHAAGLDMPDIVDAWALAMPAGDQSVFPVDPPRWNKNDEGLSANDPRPRLEAAFGDLEFGEAWEDWAIYNGVTQ